MCFREVYLSAKEIKKENNPLKRRRKKRKMDKKEKKGEVGVVNYFLFANELGK